MPFGINKAVLFGAAGSGGVSGWVVQPYSDLTGSTPDYWLYDMALADDDSVWTTSFSNYNGNIPIFHVEADGTLGVANDQKVLDPTQNGTMNGRGIAVAANGDVISLANGPINDGNNRSGILTSAYTPGTLVQDWDNSLFHPAVTPMYAYSSPITTKGTTGYGAVYYYDGSSKWEVLMFQISLADGSEGALNGANDCLHLSGSYGQTLYSGPSCVSTDSSSNDWLYTQTRNTSTGYTYINGVQIGTTTYMYKRYSPASGTGAEFGGVCGADASNLYVSFGDSTNRVMHLLKVAKSDGAVQWQRKVTIGSSTGGFDYMPPPVVDSSGNVYQVWNSKDTQLTGSSLSSVHWAKWDSSGNIQTLKGTTIKTLTTTMASSTVYTTKAAISSDDEFIYIGGSFGSPFRPFVAKLPTDGSGTDNSTALSGNFPGDDLFYKDNWVHTDAAGDANVGSGMSPSTGSISSYTGQLEDAVVQANPGIYLDEVG